MENFWKEYLTWEEEHQAELEALLPERQSRNRVAVLMKRVSFAEIRRDNIISLWSLEQDALAHCS